MNTDINQISFQPPFHSLPAEHQAWICHLDPTIDMGWVDFDQLFLTQMPDGLVIDGREFKYVGTSDGRGFYQEQEG